MPQETKSMPETASAHASPAGWSTDLADEATTFDVLERAFDFRGDVTLTLKDGRIVSGYLFDRRRGKGLADSSVRLLPEKSSDKVAVGYAEIRHIAFADRDPAAGKSFETWSFVQRALIPPA